MKMKCVSIIFLVLGLLCCAGHGQTKTDSLLQKLRAFEYGQPTAVLEQIERAVSACGKDALQQQRLASRLAEVLDSNASYAAKEFSCRQLALVGSEAQLPVLQKYLLDNDMSNMVLFALARFPQSKQVDLALRKALAKAQGAIRLGIIKAIGVRRDSKATDMLKKIVSNEKNDSTRTVALMALAHIGTEQALHIIEQAPQLAAYSDAMLVLADSATPEQAARIYDTLSQPGQQADIRSAALAGLIRLADKKANPLLLRFLGEADINLLDAALGSIRGAQDAELIGQIVAQVPALPSARQALVIQALADRNDPTIAAHVEVWAKSENAAVRMAAVEALGNMGGVASVPLLLQQAVTGSEAERKAALTSLTTLRNVDEELVRLLDKGGLDGNRKVVVLSALSGRMATAGVPLILQAAGDEHEQVRKEAFKALCVLAGAKDLPALLQLLLSSPESSLPDAEKALAVVSKRLEHDQSFLEQLVAHLNSSSDAKVRCSLLRILSGTGSQSTLPVFRQALQDKNVQVQETAIRGLSNWPDAAPADDLLQIAATSRDPLHRILALQGYLNIVSGDSAIAEAAKIDKCVAAIKTARREQEKKQAFSVLGKLADVRVLDAAEPYLADPAVCEESAMAMISVSKKAWSREPAAVQRAMLAVDRATCSVPVKTQAREILSVFDKAKEFIVDWQVAGPFSMPSVPASLLFTLQLDAEYDWGGGAYKPFTNAFNPDQPFYIDLANTLKGQNNQTAYLRTNIRSPQKQQVVFLLASDDGAKMWLNGKEVFAKNSTRTYQVDQDRVVVTLQQGWNKIMLKVMQAEGAEWGASVHILGLDGTPVSDLFVTSDHSKIK